MRSITRTVVPLKDGTTLIATHFWEETPFRTEIKHEDVVVSKEQADHIWAITGLLPYGPGHPAWKD